MNMSRLLFDSLE